MHAQPTLASPFSWIRALIVVVTLTVIGVVMVAVVTDAEADTGCGGG